MPNGISGFTNVLDVTGGYYDRQIDLRAFYGGGYFGIQSGFFAPADFDGQDGNSGYTLASVPEPARLPVYASSSTTLAFQRSVIVMNNGLIDFALSTNAWYMTVQCNRATGLFTGSFKNYYQGLDPYGVMRQKPVAVTLRGVFLPLRRADQPYADWMGYYLIPDKCRYQGPTGSAMSYPFNWSFDFRMGAMAIPLD